MVWERFGQTLCLLAINPRYPYYPFFHLTGSINVALTSYPCELHHHNQDGLLWSSRRTGSCQHYRSLQTVHWMWLWKAPTTEIPCRSHSSDTHRSVNSLRSLLTNGESFAKWSVVFRSIYRPYCCSKSSSIFVADGDSSIFLITSLRPLL